MRQFYADQNFEECSTPVGVRFRRAYVEVSVSDIDGWSVTFEQQKVRKTISVYNVMISDKFCLKESEQSCSGELYW